MRINDIGSNIFGFEIMSLYTLFRDGGARSTGGYAYPEMDYIRRVYATMLKDVKGYYARAPKNVDSGNLLANILLHIPIRIDYNDRQFVGYVEDLAEGVCRPMGLTSSSNRGKVHDGVTLGPNALEVVVCSSEDFDLNNIKTRWRDLQPVRYLYHTRTDVNLPIMNNTTPGKGYGVISVNVPMMALQYRYWLKEQKGDQKDIVNRFIGGMVLPNAVPSYLDIAFFNRLSRMSNGIGTPTYPLQHPFYLTDMVPRLDRVMRGVLAKNVSAKDIIDLASDTPMIVGRNLRDVLRLPKDPVTRQNEWAMALARLPYIKYLIQESKRNTINDQSYLNQVRISLLEAKWANLMSTVNNPELAKIFTQQLEQVIEMTN